MSKNRVLNNKKGVTLIYVLLVLVVMSLLSTAIFTLFVSNVRQIEIQEDSVKAHFIAVSGVEVAFAALMQDNKSLLNDHFNVALNATVTPLTDVVTLDNGEADITISSYVDDGLRFVRITSLGRLTGSTTTRELNMTFRVEFPEVQTWE